MYSDSALKKVVLTTLCVDVKEPASRLLRPTEPRSLVFIPSPRAKNRSTFLLLSSVPHPPEPVVGLTGFEPVTLRLSSACSNQLSYRPVSLFPTNPTPIISTHLHSVEAWGFEPQTYSLQSYRSTN